MIIFTTLKDIPEPLLEYKSIGQVVKLNLTSYYTDENISQLNKLIPIQLSIPEDIITGDSSTPEFDISYHNYIFGDSNAFFQFMSIIAPEFLEPSILVQVLVNTEGFRDAISESLMKLIQQRYGVNCYYVFSLEDFQFVQNDTSFSIPGLFAIDQDMARLRSMMPLEFGDDDYE